MHAYWGCHGKAMIITHSEYLHVALFTQQAKRMRPIILLSIAYLTLPYFLQIVS